MKKFYLLLISVLFIQVIVAQPANDDCTGAENITLTTTSQTVNFEITTAVINNEVGCGGTVAADHADVWYDFTMPVNGNLFVDGTISWNNFALYDACAGTEIQCGSNNEFFENLSSGTSYKLRVFRNSTNASNASFQSFSIQAFEVVANDDCASAESITVMTSESTVNFEIGGADINNEVGCDGTTAADYSDIWYDLTMPVTGNLYVDGGITWNSFALYDACAGTQLQCGSGNKLFTGLSSGTNYKLRLFRTLANTSNDSFKSFTIQAFEFVTNDDCVSAETITVTTGVSTVNFDIGGADINNEVGCNGTSAADYSDIWYDLTMPVTGNLYVDGGITWNSFALYDACAGTQLQCGSGNELFTGLSSGVTYKLRLFRTVANTDNDAFRSFTVQAFAAVTNDDCASAETIAVTTDESTVNFDIGGANINTEEGCSSTAPQEYADIWYDLTMPVNGNLFLDGGIAWNNFALYDSCGGNEIQCGGNNQLIQGLTFGTNYKLRVFRTVVNADNDAFRSFTIQAFEIINNDDCTSAETIVVSETPEVVNFGIAGATINNEVGCDGTSAEDYADIWYDFTMPEDGDIMIDGGITWNNFALYDVCAGTQLDCFDNSGNFTGLSSGTSYKLRVFRTLVTASNTAFKSFEIQTANTLGVDDSISSVEVNIRPNPTMGTVTINSDITFEWMGLYDMNGRKILDQEFQDHIDLDHLTPGVYFLKFYTLNNIVTKKIIRL